MKKIISLVIACMLIMSIQVDAGTGMNIVEFTDNMNGNSYSFNLEYEIRKGNIGDIYEVQLPFDVNILGGEYLNVSPLGSGKYTLEVLGDFNNIKGYIKGKKTIGSNKELNPIVIDGVIIQNEYPTVDSPGHSAERDRFYKLGNIDGDIINWEVAIGGDEKGVSSTSITDELGDGHILIKDSIKFEVLDRGQYNNDLVDMIVKNLEVSDSEINFDIDTISPGEVLYLSYQTKIIDKDQVEFSNQLIISGEQKITQSVEIESDSGITGETPEDPEKPPVLPQVGESIFKLEYIIAFILIGISISLRKDLR